MKNENAIVVLAGWLGAKKKALNTYKSFYQSIGFNNIIVKVAPPLAVFDAINRCTSYDDANDAGMNSMFDLAKQLYDEIYRSNLNLQRQHSIDSNNESNIEIIWHSFSNGGCFLLEQFYIVCVRMKEKKTKDDHPFWNPSHIIKFKAIIFDSSPCFYIDLKKLYHAAQKNAFGDDNEVIKKNLERIEAKENEEKQQKQKIEVRAHSFWEGMKTRDYSLDWNENVPELYIYSRDDPLAPMKQLKDLIQYRLQISQDKQEHFEKEKKRHIMTLEFSKSIHCDHFRCHPKEYTYALTCFLQKHNKKSVMSGTEKNNMKVEIVKQSYLRFKSHL